MKKAYVIEYPGRILGKEAVAVFTDRRTAENAVEGALDLARVKEYVKYDDGVGGFSYETPGGRALLYLREVPLDNPENLHWYLEEDDGELPY